MDADGDNRVVFEKEASAPSWSPDGEQIAFVSIRDGGLEIYVIGVDGQGPERMTHGFSGGFSPSFSPDGRQIAFYASHEGFRHIFVVEVDGKTRKRLTRDQQDHRVPAWSPDGEAIAYATSDDGLLGAKIHLMAADGKHLKQISTDHDGIDYEPDFNHVGLAVPPASKTAAIWGRLKKSASNVR